MANSLISSSQQSDIAESIHQTVCRWHPRPEQACAWYALLGARLLNQVVGSVQYGFFAGTFEIFVSPDPEEPKASFYLCFDAHNTQVQGEEFHCWIARPDPIAQTYLEVIDFSARHLKSRALEFNLMWARDPIPDFIWTDIAGIEALKVKQLRAIPQLSQWIMQALYLDPTFILAWRELEQQWKFDED